MNARTVRPAAVLPSLLLLALVWLASPAAVAQDAAPAAAPAPALDAERIEGLVATLQDEAARQRLVEQLQVLAAAQRAAEAEVPETFGVRALRAVSERVEALTGQVAALGRAFDDLPRAASWLERQIESVETRRRWARLVLELLLVVVLGLAARQLVDALLQRPRRILDARAPDGPGRRAVLLAARTLADLLPVAAFALAGYAALSLTDPPAAMRVVALTVVNAGIVGGLVMVAAAAVLAPRAPALRVVPLSDESAHYGYIWIRRVAVAAIGGYFLAEALLLLGLPFGAYVALLRIVGLVVAAMLVILILQNRRPVADWLRGEAPPPEPAVEPSAAEATAPPREDSDAAEAPEAPEAAVPETAEPPPRAPGFWRSVRARLAEVWHVLAVLYVVATYAIWALRIEGGFAFMARATVLSALILVAARLAFLLIDRLVRRGFAIPEDLRAQYPQLETRANRYLPILDRVLKAVVWIVAILALLDAWGVDSVGWLETPFGRRFVASLVSIAVVLAIAAVAWEVVNGLIDRYLNGARTGGEKVERSARVRTLLPLLRNAFLVVLVTLVTLTVLSELGVDIAPLLAGAGVVGLAIGFGSQTLVKDVITGLFILFEDTISVGDVVKVGEHSGLVEAISIRTIRLRDLSGSVHTVPFSAVGTVMNMTKDFSYYVFDIGVGYREDVDEVIAVVRQLADELQADPEYGAMMLEPIEIMGLDAFGESAVVIKARIKTLPIKQWLVGREFNRRLKKRFDELGIEIPFPHRTIYFGVDKAGAAPPARLRIEDSPAIERLSTPGGRPPEPGTA